MASNIFQRWASRKLAVKKENETSNQVDSLTADSLPESQSSQSTVTTEQKNVGEADHDAGLCHDVADKVEANGTSSPDLDVNDEDKHDALPSLTDVAGVSFDSGAAAFLKEGVEKSVKKAALSKLFHSDEFNYISDMDDHTEDFSNIPKLDTSVVKQLRGWVNEAAEKVEALTDTDATDVNAGLAHDELTAVTNINDSDALDSETSQTEQSVDDETLSDELSKESTEEEVEASVPTEIPTDLAANGESNGLHQAKTTDAILQFSLNEEITSQLNEVESHKKA
ncbi:DUF3306 domain-containing protein [Photobacterium kagoshimensis]|uniref:DUF3306 domain-containing protein n=1 Tax=Photobacterium kagoshimensis TaxID=2910242 RepID=UPI003D126E77